MKKIINGLMYDTETAKELVEWDNGLPAYDLDSVTEILYRKKNGQLFLYGRADYPDEITGKDTPCEIILPATIDEAKEWAEEKASADKYEEIFGKVSEGGELRTVSTQLTTDNWDKLHQLAEDQKTSVSELINKAIEKEYLK